MQEFVGFRCVFCARHFLAEQTDILVMAPPGKILEAAVGRVAPERAARRQMIAAVPTPRSGVYGGVHPDSEELGQQLGIELTSGVDSFPKGAIRTLPRFARIVTLFTGNLLVFNSGRSPPCTQKYTG